MEVTLHVGMGKTGTSSIQFFLRDNRERLAELGILYPSTPGRARHGKLGLFAKPDEELLVSPEWRREKQDDPRVFRRDLRRRLLREVEQAGLSRVLFSDEILFGASEPTLRRLSRFLARMATRTRVVVYLRRQDDHMVSRYQQGVKIGWTSRLADFAREDMTELYDYASRLRRHEQLLGPDELVVRRYDPAFFAGGSLHQDFLDAVGVPVAAADLRQVADRNQSLDAESVELLRLLNLHRVEHEGATPGLIDNRALVAKLVQRSAGPVLTLPGPDLDAFMNQWEDGNELVARHWCRDRSGVLFASPRRSRGTTTEQRLDPDRLEELLLATELPEQLHGPLRRLAEREARRRRS